MAWNWPPLLANLAPGDSLQGPEGSSVPWAQTRLFEALRMTLACVANDVRLGLQETVGISATWHEGQPPSVVLTLPPGTDTHYIAHAIDLENVEAWCDAQGNVHAAISPWFTTKDVDQVVLAITKVTHVLLGLHALPH